MVNYVNTNFVSITESRVYDRQYVFGLHGRSKMMLDEIDASIRYDNGKLTWENEQRSWSNSGQFLADVVSVGSVWWSLLRVLLGGTGRSPGVGLGGASESQNTSRLHFTALRLLLIIYAASATPLPTPFVVAAHVCCTAKRAKGGPDRRSAAPGIGIIARVSRARDRANRANPIESRNRFARNNNHDWIPRGFGGRTFRSPWARASGPEDRRIKSARLRTRTIFAFADHQIQSFNGINDRWRETDD